MGFAHHFEVRLHAAALGCAQPDLSACHALAEALTLDPAGILFVGDEPQADVIGPRNAGMQSVWVNRGCLAWPEEFAPPEHVIAELGGHVTLFTDGAAGPANS